MSKRRMSLVWDKLPSLTSGNTLRARRGRKETLVAYLEAIKENP